MVPPLNPRNQAFFFYSAAWTFAIDLMFLEYLLEEKARGDGPFQIRHTEMVRVAQQKINADFNRNFTFRQCIAQYRKLELRYNVFSFIIGLSSVYYDETNNVVHAFEDFVWDYVVLKYKIAEAYMVEGEGSWQNLQRLFGPVRERSPPLPVPGVPVFVDLTSDTDGSVSLGHNTFWEELAELEGEPLPIPHVPVPLSPPPPGVEVFARETFDNYHSATDSFFWDEVINGTSTMPATPTVVVADTPQLRTVDSDEIRNRATARPLFRIPENREPARMPHPPAPKDPHPSTDQSSSQGSCSSVNSPWRTWGKVVTEKGKEKRGG